MVGRFLCRRLPLPLCSLSFAMSLSHTRPLSLSPTPRQPTLPAAAAAAAEPAVGGLAEEEFVYAGLCSEAANPSLVPLPLAVLRRPTLPLLADRRR